jgi:hypothetical protein
MMTQNIWKGYMDYEKEEEWLNEMSAKGLAFTNYMFFRYAFTDSKPGEYIYRIDLLENLPSHPESKKYLNFLKESGVEVVCSWARWVYLRKKAELGSFDLYTDAESLLQHHRKVSTLYMILFFVMICGGVGNLIMGLGALHDFDEIIKLNFAVGIVMICLSVGVFAAWNSQRKKVKQLKQEKNIRE